MASVLEEFVEILVAGITDLGSAIASGVVNMAKSLFVVEGTGTAAGTYTLSAFGGIIAIFGGLALATAITSRVYIWVTSLGN